MKLVNRRQFLEMGLLAGAGVYRGGLLRPR